MMQSYGWDHMDRFNWFGATLMFVVGMIVLLAVIYIVVKLLSSSHSSGQAAGGYDRAVEILRERYARGEISNEEYQQGLETLGRSEPGPAREPGDNRRVREGGR